MTAQDYDVVVVGAGMVGAAMALALGQAGVKLALIDRRQTGSYVVGGEYGLRVSAINLASQNMFKRLGIWSELKAARVSPYQQMHVCDAISEASLHFDSAEVYQAYLGHIIENDLIQATLMNALKKLSNVDIICPAQVKALITNTSTAKLQLQDGTGLQAALIIAADGADSQIRQMVDISTRSWDYYQQALVAVVQTSEAHCKTAWQRFLPTGPIAFLPLQDGRCSIVWSTTPEQADTLLAADDAGFCAQLTEASNALLGTVTDTGPRAAFPLRYLHANSYVQNRIVLIGDAAHVVHPLAGQGVNLGFMDAAQLTESILKAISHKLDLGANRYLRRYERRRKAENQLVALSLDGIKRIFGSAASPLVAARSLGFEATGKSFFLKRFFMRHASGLHGELPELVRPVEPVHF